jgi:hypothetical protein
MDNKIEEKVGLAVVQNELQHINSALTRLDDRMNGLQQLYSDMIAVKKDIQELKDWKVEIIDANLWIKRTLITSAIGMVTALILSIAK